LVLLPYIIILLAILGIYNFNKHQNQWMKTMQLQNSSGQEAMTNKKPKTNPKY
jgi:hypothetical protein